MTKVVAIVQARMGSTRLPGKSLLDMAGRPVVCRVMDRARRATRLDEVVLAVPDLASDDLLAACAEKEGYTLLRGPAEDVLERYRLAAAAHDATVVVRVTADCPLIDPEVIDQVVEDFLSTPGEVDYVSTIIQRTYPKGLDVQVFSREALEAAAAESTEPRQREHVTTFFYDHPERFRRRNVSQDTDRSAWRWTLDYPEDMAFLTAIHERLEEPFGQAEVVALLEREPALIDLLGEHAWDREVHGLSPPTTNEGS
jgi:spore coat polysaccharide biosynthesis protein SpsF